MSFKDYFKASMVTEIFAGIFLSGKNTKRNGILISVFIIFFLLVRALFRGLFFIILLPWNTPRRKNYKYLKKLKQFVATRKDVSTQIDTAARFLNEDWYLLNVTSNHWRESLKMLSFYVHPEDGRVRIFLHTSSNEMVELTYDRIFHFISPELRVNLSANNLILIYSELRLNFL
jgi:hypothetical protein